MNNLKEEVILKGISGFFKGEQFDLLPGKTYTIGRSSTADCSLKNTAVYKSLEKEGRLLEKSFRLTSRKHFKIKVIDNRGFAETSTQLRVPTKGSIKVIIECLSANGITINGKKVSQMIIPELTTIPNEIEFGADERMHLFIKSPQAKNAEEKVSSD